MKKYLLYTILISLSISAGSQSLTRAQLRESFIQATQRRTALDSFRLNLEKSGIATAPEQCYNGICQALQIQYISGMWSKYKMLDKSRGNINQAITKAPQDAELRFMRFMLEHNIPAFLGMSTHMKEDLAFVLAHQSFMDEDAEMKKMAMEYMASSKRCSSDQLLALQKSLDDLKRKQYAEK